MPGIRRGRRTAVALAITAAAAVALTACSGSPSGSSSSSGALDLKIGTILPQTGTLAQLGPPALPRAHQHVHTHRHGERDPPAMLDLDHVRDEERQIDGKESGQQQSGD